MGSCRPLPGHPETGLPAGAGHGQLRRDAPRLLRPVARLEDMDIDGVWGQLCFPNYTRFAGHRFYLERRRTADLGLACIRTYNDYLLDEWCATDRDRLFGAVVLPLVRHRRRGRRARAGDRQGRQRRRVLREPDRARPARRCTPTTGTRLSAVAEEAGVPMCLHIGSSSRLITTSPDAPVGVQVTLLGMNSMMAGVDWIIGTTARPVPEPQGDALRGRRRAGCPTSSSGPTRCVSTSASTGPEELGFMPRRAAGCRARCSPSTCTCAWSTSTSRCGRSGTSRRQPALGGRLPPRRRAVAQQPHLPRQGPRRRPRGASPSRSPRPTCGGCCIR